jgi:hypothetical protein
MASSGDIANSDLKTWGDNPFKAAGVFTLEDHLLMWNWKVTVTKFKEPNSLSKALWTDSWVLLNFSQELEKRMAQWDLKWQPFLTELKPCKYVVLPADVTDKKVRGRVACWGDG